MPDTIMFDLDGTLLQFSQADFIAAYFAELRKVFDAMDMDADRAVKAVWSGTKAMMRNDGSKRNTERFWETFARDTDLAAGKVGAVEAACDSFYTNEFNIVKAVMKPNDISGRLIRALKAKGYNLVLATNPLFPLCAVVSRLDWVGIAPQDFLYITHYANSRYCKPNPGYYGEIFEFIQKTPGQCLMVGNNPVEDMCAGALGAETYLVTDCLEDEGGADIGVFRQGTLAELEIYLLSLPDIAR